MELIQVASCYAHFRKVFLRGLLNGDINRESIEYYRTIEWNKTNTLKTLRHRNYSDVVFSWNIDNQITNET